MDGIDRAKAARVWQRVKADAPIADRREKETKSVTREEGLPEMIAGAWTDAFVYLQLSQKLGGRKKAMLRQMAQKKQAHCACLKGVYTLVTGRPPVVRAVKSAVAEPASALRRCYGSCVQSIARYEVWSTQAEHGQVFAELARQERELCRQVLELLGDLK